VISLNKGIKVDILVKTSLGFEDLAASRIEERIPNVKVIPKPYGFMGLIAITTDNKFEVARKINEEVVEAERVIIIDKCVKADLNEIAKNAAEIAKEQISSNETFAVRTVRRGKHNFTSIDVNVAAGASIKKATGANVDLEYPSKIVRIEILKDLALISIENGKTEWKKKSPEKIPVIKFLRKIAVIQMPYLGSEEVARVMGVRIGREVQTFEVKELVVAPIGMVKGKEMKAFLEGIFEGIKSRYEIQKRTYGRPVKIVPVYIQDLHQLVRERKRKEPIIIFEPEGEPLPKVKGKITELIIKGGKRINILIGSREGIPLGVYRFADLVIDLCPGVTISTEYAAASALIAIMTILEEELLKKMRKQDKLY